MRVLSFVFRMLRRDARAGELHLLLAALVVAVAALTAVGFFTDRVRQALEQEANQLLGADLLLSGDRPWPAALTDRARSLGLATAETRSFPSMVRHAESVQLTEIKAVSEGYPLRGRLRTASAANVPDQPAVGIPAPGEVWLEERLLTAFSARVGDRVRVGRTDLRVAAVLTQEPDRGINFFTVAPRVLMNLSDLEATALVEAQSRVHYRFLVAGASAEINAFKNEIKKTLGAGQRIEDTENARPEIRTALERAQRFLGLAALLTVVLAAVAVALGARRYMQRHLDPCAIMRCLGATQGFMLRVYVGQFVVLGLLGTIAGTALGYAGHFVLYAGLSRYLVTSLPHPGAMPALQGVAVGFLLLFGFSMPPLLQLKRVSTLRVLRREFSSGVLPPGRLVAGYGLGLAVLVGLMFWVAGEARLGSMVATGFGAAMIAFALVARGFVRVASLLRGGSVNSPQAGFGWRYGLASLERRAGASVVQIVALSLGLMALLLLTATRNDLLDAWQRAVPPQAANRFVVNIQPEQLTGVRSLFAEAQLSAELLPMIRGRLTRVNGENVRPEDYADDRAQRMVAREFNLSYRAELPPGNRVSAGRWFGPEDVGRGAASVEEGLARTLGLKVGDRLEFSVAGERVSMEVVGLRKLAWDSMRVNFFVLTPPGVLDNFPASWITSFYLPPENGTFVNELVRAFPNLTVIDVAAIVRQLKSIIDQVAQAVQFIFLFTLIAGIVVLYAALTSAADERRYELAVMRALGARRDQLRRALLAEFVAIGGLSGLIAAIGALVVGQVLATRVFQMEVPINFWLVPAAMAGGALLVTVAGGFAATRLMATPPIEALRAAG